MNGPDIFQHIPQQLAETGCCILESALPTATTQALQQHVCKLPNKAFSDAGVGQHRALHLDGSYRTDKIHWLDDTTPIEAAYLAWMEQLRTSINQQLFMGLFDYESHFAHYAPGAFYKRHLDTFQGQEDSGKRVLTTIFYLNPSWHADDGGELLIYDQKHSSTPCQKIIPNMGTLVVFLSEKFPHEVIQAHRNRYSIAGWFKLSLTP